LGQSAVTQRRKADAAFAPRLGDPAAVLEMYRLFNEPAQAKLVFDSDFGAALEEPSAQHYGRSYVGYWETRNLRMTSNIRDAIAAQPGSRTLVIVGASHKTYLEAYLNQMHDVRMVNALRVLR
jgi:TRAP-type C4-dicarboxylate transport system substrate-binding protein